MSHYRIFETNEFQKKIGKISKREKTFIEKKLRETIYPQLKEEPYYGSNIKKLVNYKPETRRYRVGKYRFFYTIDESKKVIYMLSVDLRKDAY